MRDGHDELRARLRQAAKAHEPDRARILARVERGMAASSSAPARRAARPPVLGWARVVGATAAVAGVLAVGGYTVASAVQDDAPDQQTVSVSPSPEPSPDATSRGPESPAPEKSPKATPPSPSAPSAPASPPPSAPARPPADASTEDGPLRSDGSVDPHSNDFWAQSNVTVKTSEQLTALVVELRVRQTGGVATTGAWRALPEQDFTTTVEERDGYLVYRWVLKEGRTVPAGQWVFAGQYNHERGGRDARGDAYTATARADGRNLAVAGDFAAQGSDDESNGDS
ncbi:hypothetical protein [Streptomyces cavernae]|uniref:hypothetical protein n=1 Tax=Streptomyces cavernae TaxID=2259034 RepID=UPI000FEC04B1|nr:hypothetical protein [Streptomyces cavernae]